MDLICSSSPRPGLPTQGAPCNRLALSGEATEEERATEWKSQYTVHPDWYWRDLQYTGYNVQPSIDNKTATQATFVSKKIERKRERERGNK